MDEPRFPPPRPRDPRTGQFLPTGKHLPYMAGWYVGSAMIGTAFMSAAFGAVAGCMAYPWMHHHGWF